MPNQSEPRQDNVRALQNNKPCKTWFFSRGRVEFFTGGWVSCCWVPMRETQDKMKIVCPGATPWKTGIFLRGRVELFTRGWVSYCWVSMRDYAENVKNDYKADEGNKKESINIFFCATEYIRMFFHLQVKIYKDSYKLFIMSRDLCSEEFLLNVWSQKKKWERKCLIAFINYVIVIRNRNCFLWLWLRVDYNELFYFPFHDSWSNTIYVISKLRYDRDEE